MVSRLGEDEGAQAGPGEARRGTQLTLNDTHGAS